MKLFDEVDRTDSSRATHAETAFAYLNRSARSDVAVVRALLESWFAGYPAEHQADLARRFRATGRRGFEPAFFELFVHELLIRLGLKPTVHPDVSGSSRRPDFLVHCDGGSFYLEAAVVRDESREETADREREERLYDALNELDSPNFFLKVQILKSSSQTPSGRRMRHMLAAQLRALDRDGLLPPGWEYNGEGWRILFQPIAKSAAGRGKPGVRPVGIHSARSKWITTREAIRKEIAGKASRYGQLDRPFVIALNVTSDWGCDDDDVVDALFGTESHIIRWTEHGVENAGTRRNPDGAWQGPKGPSNTRNSAVLLFKGAAPWNVPRVAMRLYNNPHAQRALRTALSQLPGAIVENNVLRLLDGIDTAAIFGLPDVWPAEPQS